MNRNLKRMVFALVATIAAFAGTEYWYRSGLSKIHSTDGKAPVATLAESSNEVQRKEARRVIWEDISLHDELFAGEAIRTTEKAEAKIQLKSGTTIHLEPDSLVVLEANDNGLALDFLQGNLFVQGGKSDGSDDNLTLKTGSGQIKLKSADMSLSKDTSGQVNLEVFKGQAELQQGSQKMALSKDNSATLTEKGMAENKDRLQLLAPQAGDTILLNLLRGEKLDLTWKPLGPEYRISAEIGASRATLKRQADISVAGDTGKMSLAQRPGKWFLRLTAQSSDKSKPSLVSMVIPFTIEPKSPPSLIAPRPQLPVIKQKPDEEIGFQWTNRNHFLSQNIEIAADPSFKKIVAHDALKGEVAEYAAKLNDGTYFWRVTGYLRGNEALSSAANRFEVISNLEIKAATLLYPPNHAHISFFDAQKTGVTLKWSAPMGIERYKVLAQRKGEKGWINLADKETETPALKISEMKPGHYQWQVSSLDPRGGPAKAGEMADFWIDDIPKLEWAQAEPTLTYVFTTPTPTLVAHWKAVAAVANYRFRVSPEEIALDETPWQTTKQEKLDINLKQEGRYVGVVEAINGKGQAIAQSEPKVFVVKRAPLLPPPRWADNSPAMFKADGKGNLSLSWEEVEGAKQYMMILENAEGATVDQRAVSRTTASVSHLKPGQYKVKLKSVDVYQRPGTEGEAKPVEVPNTSDIKAPKIKAMKVK